MTLIFILSWSNKKKWMELCNEWYGHYFEKKWKWLILSDVLCIDGGKECLQEWAVQPRKSKTKQVYINTALHGYIAKLDII